MTDKIQLMGGFGGAVNMRMRDMGDGTHAPVVAAYIIGGALDKVNGTLLVQNTVSLPQNPWRIAAYPCRYPSVMSASKQVFQMLLCTATEDLSDLSVEYANYSGISEAVGATGTLSVVACVEYPIGSDNLQFFTWSGAMIGNAGPGTDITSDLLTFAATIPNGSKFRLWQWAASATGIPLCYNGPSTSSYSNANGFTITSNTFGTNLNYLNSLSTSAAKMALTATDNSSPAYFGPTAMIRRSMKRSFAFIGDQRSSGLALASPYTSDYPDTSAGLSGACERVFGGNGFGWTNLSVPADSLSVFTGQAPATGGGGRRMAYFNYVTDIVVAFGANGLSAGSASVLALESALFSASTTAGKRLWAVTIPPQGVTSTDSYSTVANQTVGANEAARLALNTQRKADARYTGGVVDFNAVVENTATPGKWKVGTNGRTSVVAMILGGNAVTGSGFTAADDGFDIVVPGAGPSAAALRGKAVYVSAGQLNIVDRIKGTPVNSSFAVALQNATIQAGVYTADGGTETQYAAKQYNALSIAVAATISAQGSTA